jgi:chemotaxis protein histidine kinase CheA
MLGFTHLANAVHVAEESFDSMASATRAAPRAAEMRASILSVRAALAECEQIYRRKLGDVLPEPDRRADKLWLSISNQLSLVKTGNLAPADALNAIGELVRRARAVPLREILEHGSRVLPVLAQELGRVAPAVEAEERELWLTDAWAQALESSLVHAFQNAMAHGIEPVEERRRRSKPEQGKIALRFTSSARGTLLRVSDDGRGLNLSALRAKAGVAHEPDEQTAARIFEPGVSTAASVSKSAGRGVGMDAVRSSVRDLGGEVSIVFTGPERDGFRPFELVFELPTEATLAEPQRTSRPPSGLPSRATYPATST